ncbi:MAG: class I adenylate-forming enzyme family protein [Halovenus sp.]
MILASDEQVHEYEQLGEPFGWTMLDRFDKHARNHPEREAVVDPPNKDALLGLDQERFSYEEFRRRVDAIATGLRKEGIEKDDIVVVQLPNCWELTALYLAVARAGGVISPLPVEWRRHELTHVTDLADAAAYVGTDRTDYDFLALSQELRAEYDSLERTISLEEVRTMATGPVDESRFPEVGPNEVFNIQWTSGTTADPKACPMAHNNWNAHSSVLKGSSQVSPGDTILVNVPMVNMTGVGVGLIAWLRTGGTFVIHHPLDLELMVEQVADEGVNFTILVPAMLNEIVNHPDVEEFDLSTLDSVITGSAPPSEVSLREFKDRWNIDIINVWGQNEGTILTSLPGMPIEQRVDQFAWLRDDLEWDLGDKLAEKVAARIDAKVVDDDGTEHTEAGETGEFAYRGPNVFPGYYNQPELNDEAFDEEGYFYTGDLFRVEEGGYLSFFDRKKDIIIRGGMNISAQEVENLVLENENVTDAAAVAMPDPRLGERTCLYVVPQDSVDDLTLEDITDPLREEVAVYKLPERLEVVDEIPRNPVGKILKTELRADIEAKLEAEG